MKIESHCLCNLLKNNRAWADSLTERDPHFFKNLSVQQHPDYLWIGCSDSRVPANEICGLPPGQVFVHRNVANVVVHSDLNCLSVMQYAVEVLKIQHVMVVGHYGCGGVQAALQPPKMGLIENWIAHVRDIAGLYSEHLSTYAEGSERVNRLCELNVIQQAMNAGATTIAQTAWEQGKELAIHAWVYALVDGLVRPLDVVLRSKDDLLRLRQTRLDTIHPAKFSQ